MGGRGGAGAPTFFAVFYLNLIYNIFMIYIYIYIYIYIIYIYFILVDIYIYR